MERDEKHLSRLARGMRDSGVPPDRDLWPEIKSAIEREESRRSVHGGDPGIPWPRLIAVIDRVARGRMDRSPTRRF